jgi:copper(I)-binding protein
MARFFLAIVAAVSLMACSDAPVASTADTTITDMPAAAIKVSEGYIMPPLKGRDVAAGFFTIESQGVATSLVAAASPVSPIVEIHTHSMADGVMQMRKVDRVDLPTDTPVVFKPGSYHLMMFNFSMAEGQTEARVTLTLDTGENVLVTLPIRQIEG